ncbi:DUF2236 domain-containing protein [Kibdelosporangium philippinense]|uniref:DUF2236 domain-containing protein n=1 Tax=Kibdelosporangium philippinense TaxID=211113 RepID=A0ABS8ZD25_9PSEU|nr:oxygenase MpaB family protein [Kibdelosporangium philippinense]MCE7004948.1 DUF2236 domain-containing protein [Kibdelosporangium philippinense]
MAAAADLTPIVETVYASDGPAVGARIRQAHKGIGGVDHEGRQYHAFEPEAYWWVLATTLDSVVVMSERYFDRPIPAADHERLLAEIREVGRRTGLRDRDMPSTWAKFSSDYQRILDERLVDHSTAHDVLEVMRRVTPPPWWPLKSLTSPVFRCLSSRTLLLATVGTLPVEVRERLGLSWSPADERKLCRLARIVRLAFRVLPRSARYTPTARKAWEKTESP